uniref:NADH-ubiquinone oxidoreductase chain 4L n=1 Tax=Dianemobius furumagiensis TaxID=2153487 RepID=A0A6B9VWP2_9ORTH|nr:NADH dehydrogenase subunit 4L [Dianemobius furumagiensis]QHQ73104.1 NADH dehydrogenase subunit 4L [Dianemobius furumagiensis]
MMKVLSVVIVIMYMSGMWVFCSKRKHLLIVLLSLEYMVLMTYLLLVNMLSIMDYNMYLLIMYLVFVVCEGALSLGIMVAMIRSYGNDYFGLYCLLE